MPDSTTRMGIKPVDDPTERNPAILDASILIVDDMAIMRKMIAITLKNAGYHNLTEAEDGDEALDKINASPPDIVILDINMPRMDGYAVCRALREDPRTAALPVLVQSSAETDVERVQVFHAGATDFVSKPINQPEMLARVAMHLENRFLIRDLSAYRQRLAAELDLAREMQQSLLPDADTLTNINEATGVTVTATYRASSELGGDLWGAWPLPDGRFGVYVLDVTGHGVASALSTFRVHSLTRRFKDLQTDPQAFIEALNAELVENFPTGQFATMFYGVFDTASRVLQYVGAGAPPPMLIEGQTISELDTAGFPLGISKRADYPLKTLTVPDDSALLLYSDVIIETLDEQDKMIGLDGLKRKIDTISSRGKGLSKGTYHDGLLADFDANLGGEALDDDLTLVELTFASLGGSNSKTEQGK